MSTANGKYGPVQQTYIQELEDIVELYRDPSDLDVAEDISLGAARASIERDFHSLAERLYGFETAEDMSSLLNEGNYNRLESMLEGYNTSISVAELENTVLTTPYLEEQSDLPQGALEPATAD